MHFPAHPGQVGRHRCRVVWVENRGTSTSSATRRTTFDHDQKVSGSARLRRDSDKNIGPRARLSLPFKCATSAEGEVVV